MAVPGPGSGSSVVVGGTWPGPPVSMEGQQQLTGAARLGHYETRCCCCVTSSSSTLRAGLNTTTNLQGIQESCNPVILKCTNSQCISCFCRFTRKSKFDNISLETMTDHQCFQKL